MAEKITIILPLDRRKTKRLATLIELFRADASRSYKEIEQVMPRTTFRQLMYMLGLIQQYVKDKYGFRLFEFKWAQNGKRHKVMEAATQMEFADMEGTMFVTFTKEI